MRKYRILVTAATTALVAMALPLTASAAAQPGLVIARGHADAGAQVRVYAWPAGATLRPGQTVHRVLLGTATAGAAGAYGLRVPAAALSAVARGGYVNLEADAGSAARFFVWHATRTPDQTATLASPATVSFSSAAPGSCSPWSLQKRFPPTWGIVGATYVLPGASHVRQSFTYLRGQVSSIGAAMSVNGGSFSTDGSAAVKATASVAFPSSSQPGNNVYRTRFRMGDYKRTCTGNVTDDLLKAVGFVGGKNVQHPTKAPAASTCQPLRNGETFTRDAGEAFTWSDGLTVNGVKISMQTGYDNSAKVTYKAAGSRHVCGTSSHGPSSSPLVVVKP